MLPLFTDFLFVNKINPQWNCLGWAQLLSGVLLSLHLDGIDNKDNGRDTRTSCTDRSVLKWHMWEIQDISSIHQISRTSIRMNITRGSDRPKIPALIDWLPSQSENITMAASLLRGIWEFSIIIDKFHHSTFYISIKFLIQFIQFNSAYRHKNHISI